MNLFEWFVALIVLGLFIYLVFALLKPEKFG
jgi:K+-transporting ATPase KdpF subunit